VLADLLPQSGSFVCEIGSGHGHFLTAYALANPDQWCVGIDIVRERIERAIRKRDRAKLHNLHFIHAAAGLFIEAMPEGTRFSDLFLLFPDPWPKLRHHKHRLLQTRFLDLVAEHAAADCRLCFRTDFEPYFEAACVIIDQHPRWRRVEEAWPFEHETVFQNRAPSHRSLIARLRP
jgi:tRNA (guanine-N7-)-methyltransferase